MNEEILERLDEIKSMIFNSLSSEEKDRIINEKIEKLKREIKINEEKLKRIAKNDSKKEVKKVEERKKEFEKVKKIMKKNYEDADCGLFNTRNIAGDIMINLYKGNHFTLDICYGWSYYEIFGASEEEFKELKKYYDSLGVEE